MKQFIICPCCGSIELAESKETSLWNVTAKAISIKQPWSYLIASGVKDIENRTWKTKFRGRVLIQVGAKADVRLEGLDLFTPLQRELLKLKPEIYRQFADYFTLRT